jgi:hypothetical protein
VIEREREREREREMLESSIIMTNEEVPLSSVCGATDKISQLKAENNSSWDQKQDISLDVDVIFTQG